MDIIKAHPLGNTGTQFRFADGHIVNLYYGKEGIRFVHVGRPATVAESDYERDIQFHSPHLFPRIKWEEYDCPVLYCDGSGKTGWAATGIQGRFYIVNTGMVGKNHFAELMAIYMALRMADHIKLPNFILISDSKNAEGWIMKGHRVNEPHLIRLVDEIRQLNASGRIAEFRHAEGHSGDPGNCACHNACQDAAEGKLDNYRLVDFKKLWPY